MLTTGTPRVLGRTHAAQVARVLATLPVQACMVAGRFEEVGLDQAALGGTFLGISGTRDGLCFDGANLFPITGDERAAHQFAHLVGRSPRRCASILGPAALVLPMWSALEPGWGPARAIRADQPLLACRGPVRCPVDPQMRPAGSEIFDRYFPAAVAMFTEEVGVDPRLPDGGAGYRSRVATLLRTGRAFVRCEGETVVAKAEIGALSARAAMIQGVWVDPAHRGRGLAAPAVAAVVAHIQASGRIACLYVNDFNYAARAAYGRVGFEQIGTFASVLF